MDQRIISIMNYNTVIVAGSVAYDEIMNFPGKFVDYIQKDKLHQINVSFVVDKLEKQLGGVATNIAYNVTLLSKKKVSVLSAVGKDGQTFLSFFKNNNIDTTRLIVDSKRFTATGKVITDTSDNQIWGYYYGPLNEAKKMSVSLETSTNTIVILSATHRDSFIKHQNECIQKKIDYLYDPGMTLTWIKKAELIEGIINSKWLIGNDYEIANILKMTTLTKSQILKKNHAIITTCGEKGVIYESKKDIFKVPAYSIKKVTDPTGAGDAWRGGFIAGIIEGKSETYSLVQGNALASFAVEHYGTVNHRPSRKQIEERIKKIKL